MKDELIVSCSPVYLNEGGHHVIVHITREAKDVAEYDRADIVLPEGRIVGYRGFDKSETGMLFDYIRSHNDAIWDLGYDMSDSYFEDLEYNQAKAE